MPALTRRRFLAGLGTSATAAALGPGLVSARASFGQPGATGALVVVFLRGGLDGLSAVVPAADPHLADARPHIAVPADALLPLDRRFGLHPALGALHGRWQEGRLTAVHAVSTPDISRSHFQAQDCLERGGASTGVTEGWLDRVLDHLGPGTPFRGLALGTRAPRALSGDQPTVTFESLDRFSLGGGDDEVTLRTARALSDLHADLDHPLADDAASAIEGLATAGAVAAGEPARADAYPDGELPERLAELARLIKAQVGVRVACLDVGGWDMHTGLGSLDGGAMQARLTELGDALGAFADDLGPQLDDVTVVVLTEFGRRVEQNANAGTDHGHGAAVLLLGGGLAGGAVHGHWQDLAPEVLDHGDVPGWNDYRDVLAEVVGRRLGLGADALADVFPGHRPQPIGVMAG
jgi:uncharacterized protein (DUF1501 family)